MLSFIFFLINAVESFLLAAYMVMVGSEPESRVFFTLSVQRLAIVLFIIIIGLVFSALALQSLNKHTKFYKAAMRYLSSERALWFTAFASITAITLILFLLTRQAQTYKRLILVYKQFEPVLAWLAVLSAQTLLFTAVWYCRFFLIGGDNSSNIWDIQRELSAVLAVFIIFTMLKLIFISSSSYGPTGSGDEMTYFDMVDSLYRGFFSIKQTHHYPPLYPLSLVIAMCFKGWNFEGIKTINALTSSSIVFPIYLLSRRFISHKKSMIAVLLSCLIPYHLVFPRRIVSENLFFPLFMWATVVTFNKPKNKNYRLCWNVMNGALVGLLYLTRYITLALIPPFLLAWWIKPFESEHGIFRPGWKKTFHFILTALTLAAVFSPWILMAANEGLPIKLALGFGVASRTTAEQLTFTNLMVWAFMYACYYFLTAAPVLNLLLISLRSLDLKKWREGFNRLIFQVLIVMGGFYAAIVRHSWRAYYNRDIPSAIMGRYLIVFSALFTIIALIQLEKFEWEKNKKGPAFWAVYQVIPFTLIIISYLAIISGKIIPTDGNLLKAQGSVDGFMIEALGIYFFIFIFAIYTLTNFFLWRKQKKAALISFIFLLFAYFTFGIPSYFKTLSDYQTYPWLAKQIADLSPPVDMKSGHFERISVFVPEQSSPRDQVEIYNGLRVRGIDTTIVN